LNNQVEQQRSNEQWARDHSAGGERPQGEPGGASRASAHGGRIWTTGLAGRGEAVQERFIDQSFFVFIQT
jgi:hypothetical protein